MEKILKLYTYVDGGIGDTPFPNTEGEPIEIGAFRYDAKRMGGAPTITASVNYPSCLDDEWTDNVYAEFNGEKYYLKQTPTSSYDNQDSMYKHDIELVSERVILDNVYFYDAVASSEKETEPIIGNPPASPEWQYFGNIDISKDYTAFTARHSNGNLLGIFDIVFDEAIRIVIGPPIDLKVESSTGDIYVCDNYGYLQELGLNLVFSYVDYGDDKPVSNSTKVVFFGNIREFASRLQASLDKCGVGYTVVVDDDVVTTEEKLMSFEDQFFSNVLQEIYNTYEVPYYFDGKTIHIGYANESESLPTFAYGVDDALLSITKNNANYKIVNRATGTGSSDNIPFYYPNNSPKGIIDASTNREELGVTISDYELFSDKVAIDTPITYRNAFCSIEQVIFNHNSDATVGETFNDGFYGALSYSGVIRVNSTSIGNAKLRISASADNFTFRGESVGVITSIRYAYGLNSPAKDYKSYLSEDIFLERAGEHKIYFEIVINCTDVLGAPLSQKLRYADVTIDIALENVEKWEYDGMSCELKDLGVAVSRGTPQYGDTITQTLVKYVNTSQKLMPYKYRETDGNEKFYNATNDTYEGITFNNPFVEGHPKEHIITVEDIKPSIKEMVNSMGLRMDMFSEFAYDLDDNDELVENEEGSEHEYVHSYFFAKLRKLDFNLFDHAIEQQPMTISFTSGDCGACNFEIGVTEEFPQKNPVQVNADGTLKRDEKGRVICGQFEDITEDECQPEQQDTINNEVWIALKKEDTTYGILMPKATIYEKDEDGNIVYDENGEAVVKETGHRPKACSGEHSNDGDTFVILGINLPKSYIINAEKKLEAEIIKYLKENNDEKFTFSIAFSRIYFEENPDILPLLSENSKIKITYNNKPYDLYVSSFSYNMSEGDALPEIRVELDDTLKVSQNALQNAISQVKSELGRAIGNIDVIGATAPYFIRKDADDEARGKINFTKGIKFGEGGNVEVMDNNSVKLTIEYLEVTKKASFTSLEIKEKTHVGGQVVISPAAMTCGEVEELEDVYRCYFQTKGANGGEEIFNQFAINDLAVSQTFNAWESRYYWRKVVGVGEDYIDLSKTICDANSDIPMAGDKIVQLGNTEDVARQAAQVLSAYGEDTPSFIMYNGINDFTLEGKNITGIIWNPETQEPQMYSYGSFFFGDRQLDGNYITFQKRSGDTAKSLTINATVNFSEDSTGLSNLEDWKNLDNKVNNSAKDLKILSDNLKDGNTIIDNGLIMTSMIAVGETNNVEAFLNGSDYISDDIHGKLAIATGVPEYAEDGNDDIRDRAAEAKTRIYEDGTLYSKEAHLQDGCTIGDVKVTEKGIEVDSSSINGKSTFDEDGVSVHGTLSNGNAFGGTLGNCGNSVFNVQVGDSFSCPLSEDNQGNVIPIGIFSSVKNGVAFRSDKGVFEGLRPKIRKIKSATTHLNNLDHTVVCVEQSGTYTVYLPQNPEDGQEIRIWKNNGHILDIETIDNKIIMRLQISQSTSHGIDGAFSGYIDLVYCNEIGYWLMVLTKTY